VAVLLGLNYVSMDKQPGYYAILPSEIRYDNRLSSSEKLFYAEITALSNKTGECWASRKYFAELFGVTKRTVTNWTNNLCRYGHIDVNYEYSEKGEIRKRAISITGTNGLHLFEGVVKNISGGSEKNFTRGSEKNFTDNNTSINTTSNNKYCYGDSQKWNETQGIDYTSFVDAFNKLFDRQLRITDKKRKMIRGRLRTFTGDEIKKAWENRKSDEWLNNEGSKYMGDWAAAMRNDEKIEKYLHAENSNGYDNNLIRKYGTG